ncbi:flagellar protein FlgN [Gluconobacter wancherniae]|uniref:flagellar protein FlgN n=1 Tax=Gluconobacter wancherniae TaxID=1307955 RepID=UPI001B8CAAB3|nr:flagellar protein FlgN [Gluconobacter wancherniae]MBS1062478.1 flagellar protein FlgN [Gluconobacter wancherniae]MBS1088780.1 flagellar protein FlgN [Gluconobacter wancherniae]
MTFRDTSLMQDLLALLETENSALTAGNLSDALALLPEKQKLSELFEASVSSARETGNITEDVRPLLERISIAMTRNEELLQLAIGTQKRVVSVLTAPLTNADDIPQAYGQKGGYADVNRQNTAVFVSRA